MTTYSGSIEVWNQAWRDAAQAALARRHVPHFVYEGGGGRWWRIDVDEITAAHYGEVVDALTAVGRPGVDWNFPLE